MKTVRSPIHAKTQVQDSRKMTSAGTSPTPELKKTEKGFPLLDGLHQGASQVGIGPAFLANMELPPPAAGLLSQDQLDVVLNATEQEFGALARNRIADWQSLVNEGTNLSDRQKMARVNEFFNRLTYQEDSEGFRQTDVWQTPMEMLQRGRGDCEDFAIAKYYTLRALGMDEGRLRICYAKVLPSDQAHMVLTAKPQGASQALVLDNLRSDLQPLGQRRDLLIVYGFNRDQLFVHQDGLEREVGDTSNLSKWAEVKARHREQMEPE